MSDHTAGHGLGQGGHHAHRTPKAEFYIYFALIFLVVVGMMLDLVRSLGAGIDVQAEEERTPLPRPESTTALPASARQGGGPR